MPPQLRQVNVSYVEVEDRLLLKVSTSDEREYRAWCTRRFTRLLMDRLEELFQEEVGDIAAVPSAARREVAEFQHSKNVAEESFQRPYEAEPREYPLGEEGVLATTLKYKQLADNVVQFHIGDSAGKGFTLRLNQNFRHQIYELFRRATQRAKWFEEADSAVGAVVH